MRAEVTPPPSPASDRYLGRVAALRALVDEIAPVAWSDPRWWALVSTIAAAETRRASPAYLVSDAGVAADTMMAWPAPRPGGPGAGAGAAIGEAIGLARAARRAVAELDGTLIDQPLAGTIATDGDGARFDPGTLDAVAFAVGSRIAVVSLAATDAELAAAIGGLACGVAPPAAAGRPFACVAVGDDAWATARHGHRRAWTAAGGPWLGLARAGDHLIASTCHYAIDGYGHGQLASRVAGLIASTSIAVPPAAAIAPPPLAAVPGVRPLAIAAGPWPGPGPARAVAVAYRLGVILGEELGVKRGMAPTIQIPVAPGDRDDVARWRRRVVPALVSVRWQDGAPEPLAAFSERAAAAIAREAAARGLASRVLAASRALPLPVRWKRRVAAGDGAPGLFAPLHDVIAGRGCVSVIALPGADAGAPMPPIAASAPARTDAIGSTVVTIVTRGGADAAITVTGSGRWDDDAACAALLDRLTDQ